MKKISKGKRAHLLALCGARFNIVLIDRVSHRAALAARAFKKLARACAVSG